MHNINHQHNYYYIHHIYIKTKNNTKTNFLNLKKNHHHLHHNKTINHNFHQLKKYLKPIPKTN